MATDNSFQSFIDCVKSASSSDEEFGAALEPLLDPEQAKWMVNGKYPLEYRTLLEKEISPLILINLASSTQSDKVASLCWKVLVKTAAQASRDNLSEDQLTLKLLQQDAVVSVIRKELNRIPLRDECAFDCLCVIACFTVIESGSLAVVHANLTEACVEILKTDAPIAVESKLFPIALNVVKNLAIYPATHETLRRLNVVTILSPFVKAVDLSNYTKADDDAIYMCLGASSVICRILGREESGFGPQFFRDHPQIESNLVWLLDSICNGDGQVVGSSWDPANVVLDMSILAISDLNKPMCLPFIASINNALVKRFANRKLVARAISCLAQFSFEPTAINEFQKFKSSLLEIMGKVIENHAVDPSVINETKLLMNFLSSSVSTSTEAVEKEAEEEASPEVIIAPVSTREEISELARAFKPAPKRGLVSRVFARSSPSTLKPVSSARRTSTLASKPVAAAAPPPDAPKAPLPTNRVVIAAEDHAMISYNWTHKEQVRACAAQVQRAGFKTWLDVDDMGDDIVDSMTSAVNGAFVVCAFLSSYYKESTNCRRELMYAVRQGKPIVYIMVESNYKPNGWLAFIMESALYIDSSNPNWVSEVVTRIADMKKKTTGDNSPQQVVVQGKTLEDVSRLLESLLAQVASLNDQLKKQGDRILELERKNGSL